MRTKTVCVITMDIVVPTLDIVKILEVTNTETLLVFELSRKA